MPKIKKVLIWRGGVEKEIYPWNKWYRYVRLSLWSNSRNASTHYVQIKCFVNWTNVALNKTVTAISWTREDSTALSRWVNGSESPTGTYIWFSGASTLQVDLWDTYKIETITFWNYYWDSRYYTGVKLECSWDWNSRTTYWDTSVDWTYYESSSWKTVTVLT